MTSETHDRIRVRVTGRVQGVFYRASTAERARALGLTGWVRNTVDGAVEIEAEGPRAALDALVEWCHRGPPAARVQGVQVEPLTALGEHGFTIRR